MHGATLRPIWVFYAGLCYLIVSLNLKVILDVLLVLTLPRIPFLVSWLLHSSFVRSIRLVYHGEINLCISVFFACFQSLLVKSHTHCRTITSHFPAKPPYEHTDFTLLLLTKQGL